MFKGDVNRLVQMMNTSNEIHSQNLIFNPISCEQSDLHQLVLGPLPPHPFFCNLQETGTQAAHPVAIQLTAGNQEAGLCAGD